MISDVPREHAIGLAALLTVCMVMMLHAVENKHCSGSDVEDDRNCS